MRRPRVGELFLGGTWVAITAVPIAMIGISRAIGLDRAAEQIGWAFLYSQCASTLLMGWNFRYALRNPDSFWGIFGRREVPRAGLRRHMVMVALLAPLLALWAGVFREAGRRHAAFRQQQAAFHRQQIDWFTQQEREDLQRAAEQEKKAAEYRAKEASGVPPRRGGS